MDYSLQARQKPQDNIQLATLGKTSGQILSDSNRPYGYDGGESTEDHRSSILVSRSTKRMPRCAISGPRGHAQDSRTSGPAIPLAWITRWYHSVCEDLPYLSSDEIGQ